MGPPSWTEVALQALNVAQTVLLAYLTMNVRRNGAQLDEIERQSRRRRRPAGNDETPG